MEAHSLPRSAGLAIPRSRRLMGALSDERLVEHVRRGNDAAFEAVFDRHHRAILSFCRHMLASQEEAEDAVQQTFVSAYDSLRVGDREIALKPWLYTIARNRCLSMLRARREQPAELDDVPTAGLSSAVQQRSDLRELLSDIRELPDDQRAALVLSELGDLSHGEIATVVGCEASKVKSLVFQARSSLIETRTARETPCQEIREQIATLRGGALRRGTLRRHVSHCAGCAEFREEVRRQRAMMAAVLPVVPAIGLKHSALAAAGISGSGAAAGGGLAGLAGGGAALKTAAAVLATGIAVGGGVVVTHDLQLGGSPSTQAASPAAATRAAAGGGAGGAGVHGTAAAATRGPRAGLGPTLSTRPVGAHPPAAAQLDPGVLKRGGPARHGHGHTSSIGATVVGGGVGAPASTSSQAGGGSAPATQTQGSVKHGNGNGNGSSPAHQNSGNHYGQVKHQAGTKPGNGPKSDTTATTPAPAPAAGPTAPAAGTTTTTDTTPAPGTDSSPSTPPGHAYGHVKHPK